MEPTQNIISVKGAIYYSPDYLLSDRRVKK